MIEIKVGGNIPLNESRSGSSGKGDWFLVPVKAEKGYDRVTVWATNPKEAAGINMVAEVESIKSVKLTARQGKDGKWYPEYSVNAKLKQAGQGAVNAAEQMAFADLDAVNDDDLPFA